MTSKNSFFPELWENLKRRTWVAALFVLYFFFYYPVRSAMVLTTLEAPWRTIQDRIEMVRELVGFEHPMNVIAIIMAIFCAIQAFSWLFHRNKLDFYLSVPVKKSTRFLNICINSFLLFILPYLIAMTASLLILAPGGYLTAAVIGEAFAAWLWNSLTFITTFMLTVIAVMLTGNRIVSFLGAWILISYEMLVKTIVSMLAGLYFSTYAWESLAWTNGNLMSPFTPGLGLVGDWVNALHQGQMPSANLLFGNILHMLILLLVYSAISWLLYSRRPSEACNKTIAYPRFKLVLKLLLGTVFSIIMGMFFFAASEGRDSYTLFGLILGVLLAHGIMEVIYELDIRAAFRKKRQILYLGVLTGLIFCAFRFDLFRYDYYVPDASRVESAALILSGLDTDVAYWTEDGAYQDRDSWLKREMKLTDTDSLLPLAQKGMERMRLTEAENKQGREYWKESHNRAFICYNLSNGKTVYRNILLDRAEDMVQINALYSSEAYKQAAFPVCNPTKRQGVLANADKVSFIDRAGNLVNLDAGLDPFFEAYWSDMKKLTYEYVTSNVPLGVVSMQKDERYYSRSKYPVYETFSNTLAYLEEEAGYEGYAWKDGAVLQIAVTNFNNEYIEAADEAGELNVEDNSFSYSDYAVHEEFVDQQQIGEILEAVYPSDLYSLNGAESILNYNITVSLMLSSEEMDHLRDDEYVEKESGTYYMLRDKVPGFVTEATLYRE